MQLYDAQKDQVLASNPPDTDIRTLQPMSAFLQPNATLKGRDSPCLLRTGSPARRLRKAPVGVAYVSGFPGWLGGVLGCQDDRSGLAAESFGDSRRVEDCVPVERSFAGTASR